jgi:peroxiredoxin
MECLAMKRKKSNEVLFIGGVIVVIALAVVMIVVPGRMAMNGTDPNMSSSDANLMTLSTDTTSTDTVSEDMSNTEVTDDSAIAIALKDVVDLAQAWMPCEVHSAWVGKPAPDFTVVDIDDKQHRLSNYRGKPVILALWTPWLKNSTNELKTLIQLKKALGDQVMIFGISFDAEANIKRYLETNPAINFPIICGLTQSLPEPYSKEKPVPGAMIIAPDGTLKISIRGSVPLDDYHALLAAK